jgi:hypothetical protein
MRLFFLSSCTCFWALHGSTCSFYSAKEHGNDLLIYYLIYVLHQNTEYEPSRCRACNQRLAQIQAQREMWFHLYLNNFHSKKFKPCSRITRFYAGLHCQAQKGRLALLDGGGGYLASHIWKTHWMIALLGLMEILFCFVLAWVRWIKVNGLEPFWRTK